MLVRVADLGERGGDGLAGGAGGQREVPRRARARGPATAVVTAACSAADSRAKSAW